MGLITYRSPDLISTLLVTWPLVTPGGAVGMLFALDVIGYATLGAVIGGHFPSALYLSQIIAIYLEIKHP